MTNAFRTRFLLGCCAITFATVALTASPCVVLAQEVTTSEPIYSGPQNGEPVAPFAFRLALGPLAGKELDVVGDAEDHPIVLIFLHNINRQSIALTRILSRFTKSRAADGLATAVILLDEDVTQGEANLKRIQHALTAGVPTGVSLDGREGPGSYGLNRSVQLTILVAKEKKVTANYALVQPSLQADLPRIVASIVEQVGGPEPDLQSLLAQEPAMLRSDEPKRGDSESVDVRSLVRPLIQKDATDEQVDTAAEAIVAQVEKKPAIRREIGRIASTIVRSGKLSNYGTPRAQEYLQKWSESYSPDPDAESPKTPNLTSDRP